MALYVGVSFAVFGNLSIADVTKYKETVLAYAAQPVFGKTGFLVISIAALLATASALNSNLFGELNTSYFQATLRQLPTGFNRQMWHQATAGFIGSLAVILLLVNFLLLSAIANVTSATFLVCYLAVHVAHYRVASATGGSRPIILLGILSITAVTVIFVNNMIRTQLTSAILFFAFLIGCWVIEKVVLSSKRRLQPNNL